MWVAQRCCGGMLVSRRPSSVWPGLRLLCCCGHGLCPVAPFATEAHSPWQEEVFEKVLRCHLAYLSSSPSPSSVPSHPPLWASVCSHCASFPTHVKEELPPSGRTAGRIPASLRRFPPSASHSVV
ncbi:hypothetical protein E1301_Tti009555 [Triplophysa tibetana]|uniref:Uncharacterized protein n=1 Tax=Triplophysa tibetana TaxID=1572043 RepID=A0A5A9NHL2_9TELE|nr:hypothetical protein E1301_Tti009555 [Triplophysa tibetana]